SELLDHRRFDVAKGNEPAPHWAGEQHSVGADRHLEPGDQEEGGRRQERRRDEREVRGPPVAEETVRHELPRDAAADESRVRRRREANERLRRVARQRSKERVGLGVIARFETYGRTKPAVEVHGAPFGTALDPARSDG